jgi:hypothetical protein
MGHVPAPPTQLRRARPGELCYYVSQTGGEIRLPSCSHQRLSLASIVRCSRLLVVAVQAPAL